MRKSYKEFTTIIKKAIVGVLTCTIGLFLCWSDGSFAASAKDKKMQKVAPSPTQTPSEIAPSPTTTPPTSTMKQRVRVMEIRNDLAVEGLQASKTDLTNGDRIQVTFNVRNLGESQIAQVSYVIFIRNGPTLFNGILNNLSPGSIIPVMQEVIIPSDLAPMRAGVFEAVYLDVIVDFPSTIAEENEMNNIAYVRVTLHVKHPDLTVTNWQLRGSEPQPLELFDVDFTIKNIGDLESRAVKYSTKFTRYGPVERHPSGEYEYGEDIINPSRYYDIYPLAPNETMRGSLRFQMPVTGWRSDGRFEITIKIDPDNTLFESNEANNTRVIEFRRER